MFDRLEIGGTHGPDCPCLGEGFHPAVETLHQPVDGGRAANPVKH